LQFSWTVSEILTLCLCSQVLEKHTVYYCDNVLNKDYCRTFARDNNVLLQHDGALANRSRQCTVAYLRSNVPEFIKPEN